jgi:hypothetical protein
VVLLSQICLEFPRTCSDESFRWIPSKKWVIEGVETRSFVATN